MTFADAAGLNLLMIVLKGTLLLVVAMGIAAALRRSPAGARHLVWLTTLATVLLFPVLARWEPLRMEILPPISASFESTAPAPSPEPVVPLGAPTGGEVSSAPAQPSRISGFDFSMPRPATLLLLVWLTGAAALIGWLVLGVLAVRRIVHGGQQLDDPRWTTPLYEVADRMHLETVPRIISSDRVEMPFACGIWQPTIVFPSSAESWNDDRRRVVLFHELAHIHRRDLIGHALGRLACALYWFHPLVWTAARQLRAESERACDDLVLACGARASDYVAHLLDIVTSVRRSGAPVTALPMARKKEFEGRMLAILDPTIPRGTPGRMQSIAILATVLLITLSVAAAVPATTAGAASLAAVRDSSEVDSEAVADAPDQAPEALSPNLADEKVAIPEADRPSDDRRDKNGDASEGESDKQIDERVETRTEKLTARTDTRVVEKTTSSESAEPSAVATPQAGDRIDILTRVLTTDADADVRISAAWALARARDPRASDALRVAARKDARSEVREMAVWALVYSTNGITSVLTDALRQDESSSVRETAAWGLGYRGATEAAPALVAAIRDESADVRQTAIWALGNLKTREPATAIADALDDGDEEVRLVAAWALGQMQSRATLPALRTAFATERDVEVRRALFRAIALMGDESEEFVTLAMKSSDPDLRSRAVRMLAGQGAGSWPWPWPWPRPRPSP